MSQYDHFASPIMGGWDSAPNNDAVFTAILPPKSIIGEVNPSLASYAPNDARRRLAVLSSEMNWSAADDVPYAVLNEFLWKDAKAADLEMPELRFSGIAVYGGQQTTQPDDGDD